MSFSDTCIRRPVGTTLLTLGLAVCGVMAYLQLPVSALPEVDFPTLVVATGLPGASADTMAKTVTTPLERQLGQVPSLRQMTSVSSFGASQISLQFELDRDLNGAEQDVQAALNAAQNLLPKILPAPPTYTKSNPADAPILTLSISAPSRSITEVHDFADSVLAQSISRLSGVGLVTLAGSQKPAVRVEVDPQALAATGLTLEDVRAAIVQANVNGPKGSLEGPRQSWSVSSDDQLTEPAAYQALVVAYKNGGALRLGDVAQVRRGAENAELAAWADANPAILLQVQRQPGANIIEVTREVRALLQAMQPQAPAGMRIDILSDRTVTTQAAMRDVQWTLLLTLALVVGVVLVFLQNVAATIVPAVTVPLSMLGTFVVMYFCGFSLDNLTLMALTVSTGLVVDDAIVMVENITRHLEAHVPPREAARLGAQEMGFTIASLTVSMVAVLLPLLLMGGIIGKLFFSFSVTLATSIIVSAVLSVTLTPMMSAQLLQAREGRVPPWARPFERALIACTNAYAQSLSWVLRHQRATLVVTAATVVLTGLLAWSIPKGFFPEADTGLITGVTVASSDISFEEMAVQQQAMAAIVRQDADVAHVASFIGSDGQNPTLHTGRLSITLQPHGQRRSSGAQVMARLQAASETLPGIALYLQPVQDLQLDSRPSRTRFQYSLEAPDAAVLDVWAPKVQQALFTLPDLTDVTSDRAEMAQSVRLHIDRDAATRRGVSVANIDDTLYDAFGQRFVSTMFTELNQYRVVLGVADAFAADPRALQQMYVPSSLGAPVPLAQVATIHEGQVPLTINHQGQFPAVTLSFNLRGSTSLSTATSAVDAAVATLRREHGMPPAVQAHFVGTAEAFTDALAAEPPLILAAIAVVYVVLGVLYESAIHPIIILSTLPSAGVGALLALYLTGCSFDMMALIGVVLLIGIVKKNAIMMIDVALVQERQLGTSPEQAIYEACLNRFRPIMMTTCAAFLGALPMALGIGVGSELRQPMGISIVGGLAISQLLTLFTTPVVYLAMGRLQPKRAAPVDVRS